MMKARILVVDDEEGVRFVLRKMLEGAGYEVLEAESGERCLEIVNGGGVDLVLMDVMMPGMDGWEVTRRIKENPETRDIPVAMLTVRSEDEDKARSFQNANADAHIDKPIIVQKTLGTIEWLLNKIPKKAHGSIVK